MKFLQSKGIKGRQETDSFPMLIFCTVEIKSILINCVYDFFESVCGCVLLSFILHPESLQGFTFVKKLCANEIIKWYLVKIQEKIVRRETKVLLCIQYYFTRSFNKILYFLITFPNHFYKRYYS